MPRKVVPKPTFPLHLFEVMEEELAVVAPDPSPPRGREAGGGERRWGKESLYAFDPRHLRLRQIGSLFARLRDPGDEVGQVLRSRMSGEMAALLDAPDGSKAPPLKTLVGSLVTELNALLENEKGRPVAGELARACRKMGDPLSPELEILLADPPAQRKRLLRLLLEEVFPAEIEPIAEIRLRSLRRRVHAMEPGLSALCLSGGGVRSAVFSLGVVQALAGRGLLQEFHYLSTVSGGGYLGGLLSAWRHRHPEGMAGVAAQLGEPSSNVRTLQPEPSPLRYVRSYGNYLTPRLGILSGDSWTLVAIVLRNLALFWLVLVPLLLAFLALPRLYVALCSLSRSAPRLEAWGPPLSGITGVAQAGLLACGALLMIQGLTYTDGHRPSNGRNEPQRRFFRGALLPLTVSAVFLTVYWSVSWTSDEPGRRVGVVVLAAILANGLAWTWNSRPALRQGRVSRRRLIELAILVPTGACGGWVASAAILGLGDPTAFRPSGSAWTASTLPWYGVFAVPIVLLAIILGETVFAGLATRWTDDEDREWSSRVTAWLLVVACGWVAVSGVVLFGPVLLLQHREILAPVGGLAGLATALLARSSLTAADRTRKAAEGWSSKASEIGLALAAPVFVVLLGAAFSLGTSRLIGASRAVIFGSPWDERGGEVWHLRLLSETPALVISGFIVFAFGFGLLMAYLIDINKFSLHAMYRNRLIRAFLGASRENRSPNPFTGFDSDDNLALSALRTPLFLRIEDLRPRFVELCHLLLERDRPVARLLFQRHLADGTRDGLDRYREALEEWAAAGGKGSEPDPDPGLLPNLVEDLNRLIQGWFEEPLMQALRISDRDRKKLDEPCSDDQRWRIQRKALRRAVPQIGKAVAPRPLHLLNVALNLVAGKKLAWQQRKAAPFTFSALHSGSARVGYRRSIEYAKGGTKGRPITLGTAMAISGAAASPSMGYHSSPAITFLMTFFNARLGWWLGNPGVAGAETYRDAQPQLSVSPLLSEALGQTDDCNKHIYLSDGGHFDNLGLYEMVLRRCRHIVVIDAGQDEECRFEDLGNALRKIRIDLGIEVKLESVPIWTQASAESKGRYCAVGRILYSQADRPKSEGAAGGGEVEDGTLLYIKPVVYDDGEPKDVVHYKKLNATFPHESTADQWFSESQFESYRALGQYAIDAICGDRWKRGESEGARGPDDPEGKARLIGIKGLVEAAGLYLGPKIREAATDAESPCGGGHSLDPEHLETPTAPEGGEPVRPPSPPGGEAESGR